MFTENYPVFGFKGPLQSLSSFLRPPPDSSCAHGLLLNNGSVNKVLESVSCVIVVLKSRADWCFVIYQRMVLCPWSGGDWKEHLACPTLHTYMQSQHQQAFTKSKVALIVFRGDNGPKQQTHWLIGPLFSLYASLSPIQSEEGRYSPHPEPVSAGCFFL